MIALAVVFRVLYHWAHLLHQINGVCTHGMSIGGMLMFFTLQSSDSGKPKSFDNSSNL